MSVNHHRLYAGITRTKKYLGVPLTALIMNISLACFPIISLQLYEFLLFSAMIHILCLMLISKDHEKLDIYLIYRKQKDHYHPEQSPPKRHPRPEGFE